MHVGKRPASRRLRVVPLLVLLAATLVLVAAGHGGTGNKPTAASSKAQPAAGGFGEVYKAQTATLKKALFNAKLLPANKTARNIALAGLGRADKPVNQNLALKCWKNNGCSTGTGGKLKVAYVEGFGENVFRQISKMEFILQALSYPSIGKIIYTSAHSDPAQALTDFRAAISQHVNVIVTYPDFGDAMLPVFKEATKAGIPVATYAWGYVTGPGKNYLTVVGEDTYGLGMAQGAFSAYKAAGKPFNAVLTLRTDDVGMGCAADKLHNPKLRVYYYTAGNSQIRVALTAAMMKLKGAKIPPQIVFPIQLQNQAKRDSCVKGYPQEASATSLVPLSLLHRMYP